MKVGTNFFEIWGGIAGAQHNYPLLLEEALRRDVPLSLIARLTSLNVARRFRLGNKGDLRVGWDADLVVVNPRSPHEIVARDLLTRHPQSAYLGRKTNMGIAATIVGGQIIHGINSSPLPYPARILHRTSL
jgi:allantoinase